MFDLTKPERLAALHRAARDAAKGEPPVDLDALVGAAGAAIVSRSFERALEVLAAVLVLEPENARAWALSGISLEQLGRADEAVYAYETAIGLGDGDATIALALANMYERRGEGGRALALVSWLLDDVVSADDAAATEVGRKASALRRALEETR